MANTAIVEKKKNEVVYEANGEQVTLTPEIVKSFIVSGNSSKVTNAELYMFMQLCRYNHINPFLKEAYLIKYGNDATMVCGKELYMKRADASGTFDGMEAGIVIMDKDGEIKYRKGEIKLKGEEIIGGWCDVYKKDITHPFRVEVSYDEYVQLKDGKPNSQWAKRPGTMIRKVAVVHALKEAFPNNISGMETDEEVDRGTIDIVVEERKAIAEAQNMMGSGGAIDIPAEVIEEPVAETAPDPGF